MARAIHYSSPRKDGPFVCLNCAALTETLLESELFGHEKGSFTGATEKKIGKFEAANHGTIFLDEIGEMNVGTQAKLLRILEGHPFERVGGSTPIRVDVRVVAATNQPLEQAIQRGHASAAICSSACRWSRSACRRCASATSDVPLLAEHFLQRFVRETGRKIRGFTPAALQEDGGLPLARQRPRAAQRRRAGRRPGHGPHAGRQRHLAVLAGDCSGPAPPSGEAAYRAAVAGGDREATTSCRRWTTPTGTRARPPASSTSSARRWIARSRATG